MDSSSFDSSVGEQTTTFTDRHGRVVHTRAFEGCPANVDGLVEMYTDFHAADRAQGLPPREEDSIQQWLDRLDGLHVIATHWGAPVGHAMLIPDGEGAAELAIFVRPAYHGARIGTHILEELLDYGDKKGVPEVGLHVEQRNDAAIALYRKCGFTVTGENIAELKMRRSLGDTTVDEREDQ